jgi:dienelactone hydrolase
MAMGLGTEFREGPTRRPGGRRGAGWARLVGLLLLLPLFGCAVASDSRNQVLTALVAGGDGSVRPIQLRLCLPEGPAPARLVVVNHGSPGEGRAGRANYGLLPCHSEVARHFLERGEAVLAPLRRGYGGDAGPWSESFGRCDNPDYAAGARETARDIRAAITRVQALSGIAPDGIVVIGQSAGGWAMLALAADPPPGVSAIIAVAPGRGGHRNNQPGENCRPDRLIADAAGLARGRGGPAPLLWLATENDSFFPPPLARAMQAAHAAAGGRSTFLMLPAWGTDGHDLFYGRGGSTVWGPPIDAWIDSHR